MSLFSRTAIILAALTLFVSTTHAEDLVDNPMYQSWAKYKPGTTIQMRAEKTREGKSKTRVVTMTLISVTPEKVVVETNTREEPQSVPQDRKNTENIPAKTTKAQAESYDHPQGMERKELPDEEVKVGDKTFKCKVVSCSDATESGTAWLCPDMPGLMVKFESNHTGNPKSTKKAQVEKIEIK